MTQPVRARLVDRLGAEHWLVYGIHCPWCVSIYTGAIVAAAWAWIGDSLWFTAPALALSASYVTGWLESRTED